jgi:hypothetical protein
LVICREVNPSGALTFLMRVPVAGDEGDPFQVAERVTTSWPWTALADRGDFPPPSAHWEWV